MKTKSLIFIGGFILIMFLILFLDTYIHEQGHILSGKEQNVCLKLKSIEWTPRIDEWGSGKAVPCSEEDCQKFNFLPLENKQKITHAGVKFEFLFITPLLVVSLFLLLSYYKKLWGNNWVLLVLLILFVLLLLLIEIYAIKGNVFTSSLKADWNFINFSNCSIY